MNKAITATTDDLTDTAVLRLCEVLEQGRQRVRAHFENVLTTPLDHASMQELARKQGESRE